VCAELVGFFFRIGGIEMSFGAYIAAGVARQMILPLLCLVCVCIGIGIGISWIPTLIIYLSHHLTWTP